MKHIHPIDHAVGEIEQIRHEMREKIKRFGHTFMYVSMGEQDEPCFYYTVGLAATYGLPELLWIGNIRADIAMEVMCEIAGRWIKESKVTLGLFDDLMVSAVTGEKGDTKLVEVSAEVADRDYTCQVTPVTGVQHYRVVQVLWADREGRLPDNPDYTKDPYLVQPILPRIS